MPKQRKQRRSRRKLPWTPLGAPIERMPVTGADEIARRERFDRMIKLKEYYGIHGERGWEPWYQLAVAIASEFDEGCV